MSGLTPAIVAGVGCAALGALGSNLSYLLKHRGAVLAPAVDMQRPLHSAAGLFRSKWWSIGWAVAAAAFALHVAALALAPLSIAQSVLAGGFVLLAVLAERWFGFRLGRRQWAGIGLAAAALTVLALTASSAGDHADYAPTTLIAFEAIAVAAALALVRGHCAGHAGARSGVLLGVAAGLGFGIGDVAIKALTGDLAAGPLQILTPWSIVILAAGIASFYASARSLQLGDAVAVIAVTSVAANASTIAAGVVVFGDPLGSGATEVALRCAAFAAVLGAGALMPAPVRALRALRAA